LTYTELARRVRAQLGQDHRYDHTVRVARCAEVLAQRHGADPARARLAGMLHDLARLYSPERLLNESQARGLAVDAFERENPIVLHARLGALIAAETFGVRDPQVLSAIEKHTTAAADMSPLDCVVYLADSLEPGRTFAERAELWETSMRDLNEGMRATLSLSIGHLAKKGRSVAPPTLAAARAFGIEMKEARASS
jgi:predicted HD superfamily hydrolase involved in NAD metabolism